jgi:hypothetical protein
VRKLPAGAWIKTAEGWREIPGARPQVVFVLELHGGWVSLESEPGYDWPETFGDDE